MVIMHIILMHTKLAQYSKKISDTVTHIDSEVEHVKLNSESGYVDKLKLSNGDTVQRRYVY